MRIRARVRLARRPRAPFLRAAVERAGTLASRLVEEDRGGAREVERARGPARRDRRDLVAESAPTTAQAGRLVSEDEGDGACELDMLERLRPGRARAHDPQPLAARREPLRDLGRCAMLDRRDREDRPE